MVQDDHVDTSILIPDSTIYPVFLPQGTTLSNALLHYPPLVGVGFLDLSETAVAVYLAQPSIRTGEHLIHDHVHFRWFHDVHLVVAVRLFVHLEWVRHVLYLRLSALSVVGILLAVEVYEEIR